MTPEDDFMQQYVGVIRTANRLDPIIREALRPVCERLKADVPDTATAMALALICRALRMVQTDGTPKRPYQMALLYAAMLEVTEHPEPSEGW